MHSMPDWAQVEHGWSPEHLRLRAWQEMQAARERLRGVESVMAELELERSARPRIYS
jgi:hypothetical protein